MIKGLFYIMGGFLIVITTHGIFAAICRKNKREFWNVFRAVLTFDRKYLTEHIDYDRFLKMVHNCNLISIGICFLLLLISACDNM